MVNFFDKTLEELREHLAQCGKEKFRAQQIYRWVYQKGILDPEKMTNMSKDFRSQLLNLIEFKLPKISHIADSSDGTRKFLMDVDGGKTVESVLIPNGDRLTLCVSSEVGCAMGCRFCFTSKMGLMRRLLPFEIVGQFVNASANSPGGRKITNIVFMGMGEPLDNVANVRKAIEILHNQHGFGFPKRRITVSTSGIAPLIREVAEAGVRLAVSLNATTDEIRDKVMPINKKYPLTTLLDACREYASQTGDKVTFEYVLLKGVNDSRDDAHRIVRLTKNIPNKINLIPFNEHPDSGFHRPPAAEVLHFQRILMDAGRHVLIRKTMGRDIFAACGQLRSEMEKHPTRMAIQV
ncbi:MAG: 23S rRNA (adenine(2503)-C(2))-methyltransferase RlmN [Oligoflexia bacterium]|nr:23S rRNA (adenine(2503)-C(2))-methyltransferase RlmN [Oligoflexia bacterium]